MLRKGTGFTLIELLVVIAIIAILAAILFPVFANAKETARQASCAMHQKQLAAAMFQYAQDNDGRLPAWKRPLQVRANYPKEGFWNYVIQPYLKNYTMLWCPARQFKGRYVCMSDYGINIMLTDAATIDTPQAQGVLLSQARYATKTVLCAEGIVTDTGVEVDQIHVSQPSVAPNSGWACRPVFRHNGKCNVLWLDGHSKCEAKGSAFYPAYKSGPRYAATLDALWDLK